MLPPKIVNIFTRRRLSLNPSFFHTESSERLLSSEKHTSTSVDTLQRFSIGDITGGLCDNSLDSFGNEGEKCHAPKVIVYEGTRRAYGRRPKNAVFWEPSLDRTLRIIGAVSDAFMPKRHFGSHCNDYCIKDLKDKLADAKDVTKAIQRVEGARFPVLTPNLKGFNAAIAAGAREVAIFAAASESFSRSNINCSIEDSLARYSDVALAARDLSIPVRGYISCVVGCPVEGAVPPTKVAYVAKELLNIGCSEISLGDTIGVGTPGSVIPMLEAVIDVIPVDKLAVHFHDTYGQALSNILVSLQMGIGTVDSSVSGLGGCPYAKGASGNVATEDVVYMLNGLGVKTNVDLKKVISAGDFICKHLGRPSGSKVAIASSRVPANSSKL